MGTEVLNANEWQSSLAIGTNRKLSRPASTIVSKWGREALFEGNDNAAAGHWQEALEAAEQAGELDQLEIKVALERVLTLLPRRRREAVERQLTGQ